MKFKIKNLSLALLLFTFGLSCTEPIDIDLNSGKNDRLVVEGGITDNLKKHKIKLTRTTDYFVSEVSPAETGATVSITDGSTVYDLSETEISGIYETDSVAGEAGKTYTLDIKLQNGETYTASSLMLPIQNFDSIQAIVVKETIFGEGPPKEAKVAKVLIYAQEPDTPGDFYIWNLYINNELDTDTLQKKVFTDDTSVNGSYINGLDIFVRRTSEIPQTETINFKVTMSAISKEQYNHHQAILFETAFRGGPFETPPANIPTNISGGALGFFTANSEVFAESELSLLEILGTN